MLIQQFDREKLRAEFRSAKPFPFIAIDDFLEPSFAAEVAAAVPDFATAERMGFQFNFVNERRKVQITDTAKFTEPVRRLNDLLASQAFLDDLSYVTGIPQLLADEELRGGGVHVTGPGGRLDVHVDFNTIEDAGLYRRLNILVFLNPTWLDSWGGQLELWDRDVAHREHAFAPRLNRCVVFETSEISYHGVAPLTCPNDVARRSFAAYYYTREASAHARPAHSTIFKARPNEALRGALLMPAERLTRDLKQRYHRARGQLKRWLVKG